MFAAGSNLSDKTPEEIIHQDFKKFNVGDLRIGIGQISSMDNNELAHLKEATLPSLDEIRRKDSLDMLFFMMTNIIKESSEVLFSGKDAESVLENGFNVSTKDHSSVTLPGVVSRKKQMLPTITNNIGLKN